MNRRNFLKRGMDTLVTLVAGSVVAKEANILKEPDALLDNSVFKQSKQLDQLNSDAMDAANKTLNEILNPDSSKLWGDSIISHPTYLRAQQDKNALYRNLMNSIV